MPYEYCFCEYCFVDVNVPANTVWRSGRRCGRKAA